MTKTCAQLALLLVAGCQPAPAAPPTRSPSPPISPAPQVEEQVAPLKQACEGTRLDLDWVAHSEACVERGAEITELPLRLEPARFTLVSGERETLDFVVANDTATAQTYVVGYCAFRDGLTLSIVDEAGNSVDKPACGSGMSCGGPPIAFTLAPGGTARWPLEFAAVSKIEDETCEVVRREPLAAGVYGIKVRAHGQQTLEAELVVLDSLPLAWAGSSQLR